MPSSVAVRSSRRQPARQRADDVLTRVNALRIDKGLTVRQLAQRTGVATRTIDRMMAGTRCGVRAHARVAAALGVDALVLWPHLMSDPELQAVVALVASGRR